MKTKYLLVIGCMFFILFSNLTAQNIKTEKNINGEVYLIDKTSKTIKNKKNGKFAGNQCDQFFVEDIPFENIIKKVFSKARIEELSKSKIRILLLIYCGASRKIEEVSFYIPNGIDTISLTEIQLLEKNMIGIEMKIDGCDGNKNYFMVKRYTFGSNSGIKK